MRGRGAVRVAAGDGAGLSSGQSRRIEQAVSAANDATGLRFSVFVGDVVESLDGELPDPAQDAPDSRPGRPAAEERVTVDGGDGLRATAERLHAALGDGAREGVLVLVAPGQRRLEIVTGPEARRRVPDRAASLAALSMSTSFSGGDLVGGVVTGLRMLADAAGRRPEPSR